MISLQDWLTSSSKYPEREKLASSEVVNQATTLINIVNKLLNAHGINGAKISSGFRPESVNSLIKSAAKRSGHITGMAVDLEDKSGKIKALVSSSPAVLRELGLFMEHPSATPTWCHIDCIPRVDRPNRLFIP